MCVVFMFEALIEERGHQRWQMHVEAFIEEREH